MTAVSVLPEHLESARQRVKKIHIKLYALFIVLLLAVVLIGDCIGSRLVVPVLMTYIVGYAFFLLKYIEKTSKKLGYTCPHCMSSLYSFTSLNKTEVTGCCPKCKQPVADSLESAPASNILHRKLSKTQTTRLIYFAALLSLICLLLITIFIKIIPRDVFLNHKLAIFIGGQVILYLVASLGAYFLIKKANPPKGS